MDEKKPAVGASGDERDKDALRLLAAMGEIDNRFVAEAAEPETQATMGDAIGADSTPGADAGARAALGEEGDTADMVADAGCAGAAAGNGVDGRWPAGSDGVDMSHAAAEKAGTAADGAVGATARGVTEAAAKKGVLRFTPARLRVLAGVGLAACLLVAGAVVFTQPDLFNPTNLGSPAQTDVSGQQGQDAAESAGEPVVMSLPVDGGASAADGKAPDVGASGSDAASASNASAVVASAPASSEGAAPIAAYSGDAAGEAVVTDNVGKAGSSRAKASSDADSSGAVAMSLANPWQWCTDLDDAQTIVGFAFDVDSAALPTDVSSAQAAYQVIAGELIEVDYSDASGDLLLYLRKGTGGDDVSGDYSTYDLTQVRRLAGQDVALRGSDDAWHVASWTDGGYSYAIGASSPLTTAQMEALVAGME